MAFSISQSPGRASALPSEETRSIRGRAGSAGTTQLSFNPATGGLFFLPTAQDAIVDGKYVIPVPKGSYRWASRRSTDQPVPAGSISFTTQIGGFFGQLNFSEEFYNRNKEAAIEVRPGRGEERRRPCRPDDRRQRHHHDEEHQHQQLRQPELRRVRQQPGRPLLCRQNPGLTNHRRGGPKRRGDCLPFGVVRNPRRRRIRPCGLRRGDARDRFGFGIECADRISRTRSPR